MIISEVRRRLKEAPHLKKSLLLADISSEMTVISLRYNGERVVNPSNKLGYAYHLIIDDGVERVPRMHELVYNAIYAMEGDLSMVRKITMANSVKHLGDNAFADDFQDVEEIIWSKNLETIGERALQSFLSRDTLKFFGPTNFLPPSCRLIGPHAFADTQCLEMIIIPEHALVHPSAFQDSSVWDNSPFNQRDANPRQLINWIKYHQHDDHPIHAMFAKTQIDPEKILHELCNNDEYLSSFACSKLYKDKDRHRLTPMDYLHQNPYVDEKKFDELKLIKASVARILGSSFDGIGIEQTNAKAATEIVPHRGIFMILSPAKTLDLSPLSSTISEQIADYLSTPGCDVEKTTLLVNIMKSKSKKQLKDMLKVSNNIAATAKDYYEKYQTDADPSGNNAKPAVFSFNGQTFKGISASTCSEDTLMYMQSYLRIIDPLFGALSPLSAIQPYRLEMATKKILEDLDTDEESLASWWKSSVTSTILKDMKAADCTVCINLASDEYSSAVDATVLNDNGCKFVKIVFQTEGRVVAVHAKRARGLMVRYIAENKIMNIENIHSFDVEGYSYCEGTSDDTTIVFDRSKNWNTAKSRW